MILGNCWSTAHSRSYQRRSSVDFSAKARSAPAFRRVEVPQPAFHLRRLTAAPHPTHHSSPMANPPEPNFSDLYHTLSQDFDASVFQHRLNTKHIGRHFLYRKEVSSTMDVIGREALEGAPTGTLVLAEAQTKGRGRVARPWASPKGNLFFSVLLRPKTAAELPKMNFAVALAVASTAREAGVLAHVKWPNDVWIGEKKAAGILLDSSFLGKDIHACIGVGVNVNCDMHSHQDEEVRQVATSFYNALGKALPLESVLASICNHLESYLTLSMDQILTHYKQYDMLVGKDIIVMPKKKEDPARIEAHALGFTHEGYLQVKLKTGAVEELCSEEVSIRPSAKI